MSPLIETGDCLAINILKYSQFGRKIKAESNELACIRLYCSTGRIMVRKLLCENKCTFILIPISQYSLVSFQSERLFFDGNNYTPFYNPQSRHLSHSINQ